LLYFNSERPGGVGEEDIWFVARASVQEPWGSPMPVSELNTEQRETGIGLTADGLTIFFSSDRPGGAGGLDVYRSTRVSRDARWSEPVREAALSSPGDDLVS